MIHITHNKNKKEQKGNETKDVNLSNECLEIFDNENDYDFVNDDTIMNEMIELINLDNNNNNNNTTNNEIDENESNTLLINRNKNEGENENESEFEDNIHFIV